MPATRSSARQAAGATNNDNNTSSQSTKTEGAASGSKRKGASVPSPKAKRGKKSDKKEQATIEESMPRGESQDVKMEERVEDPNAIANGGEVTGAEVRGAKPVKSGDEVAREQKGQEPKDGQNNAFEELGAKSKFGRPTIALFVVALR